MTKNDRRDNVKKAMEGYYERQTRPEPFSNGRTNKKPEKLVEKSCMGWFKDNDFSMHIVECRAVYNPNIGRHIANQTVKGFTDSVGNTPSGIAAFVEFKAINRRCALKPHQRKFITDKINMGCFAVVVDRPDQLTEYYNGWLDKKLKSRQAAIKYLIDCLPKITPSKRKGYDLF